MRKTTKTTKTSKLAKLAHTPIYKPVDLNKLTESEEELRTFTLFPTVQDHSSNRLSTAINIKRALFDLSKRLDLQTPKQTLEDICAKSPICDDLHDLIIDIRHKVNTLADCLRDVCQDNGMEDLPDCICVHLESFDREIDNQLDKLADGVTKTQDTIDAINEEIDKFGNKEPVGYRYPLDLIDELDHAELTGNSIWVE